MDQLEEVHDIRMNDFDEEANEEERDAAADAVTEAYLARNLAILRKSNARAVSFNRSLEILRESKIKAFSKIEELRAEAHVWMLSKWMTNPVRQRVEMDPAFVPLTARNPSTVFEILEICRRLFSDREPEILIRQDNALEALKQVKMSKTTGFIAYNVAFQNAVDTLVYHGRELSDVLLINFYSRGLHDAVFQDVKRDLQIPSKKALYPGTYPGFVKEMEEVHNRFEGVGKSYYDEDAINIMSASTGDTGREQKEPMVPDSSPPGGPGKGKSCPFCEKIHPGNVCLDEKAMERVYLARVQAAIDFKAARAEKKKREAVTNHHFDVYNTSTSNLPPILPTPSSSLSSIPTSNTPPSSVSPIQRGVGHDEVDFIHDCAAAVGLLADSSLGTGHKSVSFTVLGAVPNSSAQSDQEVELRHGFGSALVLGKTNIISDWQISKSHKMEFIGENCIRATGRASMVSWDFIRDPDRYGDRKYHLTIKRDIYLASAGEDHASDTTSEGAEDEGHSSFMTEQIMRSLEEPHGTPASFKPDDSTLEGADVEAEPEPDPCSMEARPEAR